MNALEKAVRAAGSQSVLAEAIGVSQQRLSNWLRRKNARVPIELCPAIEQATGVKREALRPDVDWVAIRAQPRKGRR